ncbi:MULTISPECIES: DUF4350 domain-containing protein [unclassified Novosphingobium]|uniref:DUF4350 domain-containing protein n=1 Tax=unclassified Novosphingobium TaxID=2644732 RepID=UPI0025E2107C|nr:MULTISPECIES: DUF4350 domain-containing protein [unclassified Novosphingobium]HQS68783.1 DUF4350 domain-containing protein [Novosphingobium sp.]
MSAAASPFSRGTVIGMLLVGALSFAALLWFLGNNTGGSGNNGGAHVGGKGLTGFAGLAKMLEADGLEVQRLRNRKALESAPGLLILTPPAEAEGKEIAKIVAARRYIGPTLIVAPKWLAMDANSSKAKRGWVQIVSTTTPEWRGFADDVTVELSNGKKPPAGGWRVIDRTGETRRGKLPDDTVVESGSGKGLVPIVNAGNGKVLAAWLDNNGYYPALNDLAGIDEDYGGDDEDAYPVVLVFEPDLMDNWGLADRDTALLARDLVLATADDRDAPIAFDMTFNGFGASRNLLTLAFEPPFLAATICLFLAALAVAWRALHRFGPALQSGPEIALGKAALVANAAGLIRRAGRVHLASAPYADAVRERIALALGLPRGLAPDEVERQIDVTQERRAIPGPTFSSAARHLRDARKPHEVTRRALVLQQIERLLK